MLQGKLERVESALTDTARERDAVRAANVDLKRLLHNAEVAAHLHFHLLAVIC